MLLDLHPRVLHLGGARSVAMAQVAAGRRLFVAVVVGLFGGAWCLMLLRAKAHPGDFSQIWYAARAVLAGQDPYPLIGPGRAFDFDFPLRYPLPAVLLAVPFAPFRQDIASCLFIGLGLACLAWVLMEHGHAPLIGLLSAGVSSAINSVQWSPLLAAATVLTPLGVIFVAKPTIGAAMFAARPSRWAIVGGAGLVALAFLVQPHWLTAWRGALSDRTGLTSLLLHPGGAVGLLCVLRWRRPEARMLAVLVCVPMAPILYETAPLVLIPRRWWEAVLLVLTSYGVLAWVMRVPLTDAHSLPAHLANSADGIALILVPVATLMVLMRPNEGTVPAWLDRAMVYFPLSLRGARD